MHPGTVVVTDGSPPHPRGLSHEMCLVSGRCIPAQGELEEYNASSWKLESITTQVTMRHHVRCPRLKELERLVLSHMARQVVEPDPGLREGLVGNA